MNNPFKGQSLGVKILAVIAATLLVIASAYAVTYVLQTSNEVDVDVTSGIIYVPITLSSNGTSMTDLDHLTLTAATGSNGNGLTVHFYDGTVSIGQAVISSGSASITVSPSFGTHHYTAGP